MPLSLFPRNSAARLFSSSFGQQYTHRKVETKIVRCILQHTRRTGILRIREQHEFDKLMTRANSLGVVDIPSLEKANIAQLAPVSSRVDRLHSGVQFCGCGPNNERESFILYKMRCGPEYTALARLNSSRMIMRGLSKADIDINKERRRKKQRDRIMERKKLEK
eukprot:156625_1